MKNLLRFLTILFSLITLSALMAHLLELPSKMELSKESYAIVQQIYSGWALLGFAEVAALVLTAIWTILDYNRKTRFRLLITALLCFVISLAVFFIFTFPANKATLNWTTLPADWRQLREKWEYSHAARALLNLGGFLLLIVLLLQRSRRRHSSR